MVDCIRSTDLLLIPGMMCDARLWRHQVEALSGQYRIQVASMSEGDSIKTIAEQILASAPPSFAVAGLSMGAIVAFELWRQAPERIERIALLDTNYRADAPERFAIRNRQIEQAKAGQLTTLLRDELKPSYLAAVHQDNTELLAEVLAMGVDLGTEVFINQSIALRDRIDSTDTLATIDCPVSIICGNEDRLCAVSLHEAMAIAMPHAELHIVKDSGHLSTLEQPQAVNQLLQQWLQSQQRKTP